MHAIDLLVWFLGTPAWVSGASASLARSPAAEDTAVAAIGFSGGALAVLAAGTATNRSRDDIMLEVSGTRGGFRLEIRDYDAAEITRLDVAPSDDVRARSLPAFEIERLVRAAGGAWRDGPKSALWRLAARIAGPGRGSIPSGPCAATSAAGPTARPSVRRASPRAMPRCWPAWSRRSAATARHS